jgi:hypothetical protein
LSAGTSTLVSAKAFAQLIKEIHNRDFDSVEKLINGAIPFTEFVAKHRKIWQRLRLSNICDEKEQSRVFWDEKA